VRVHFIGLMLRIGGSVVGDVGVVVRGKKRSRGGFVREKRNFWIRKVEIVLSVMIFLEGRGTRRRIG